MAARTDPDIASRPPIHTNEIGQEEQRRPRRAAEYVPSDEGVRGNPRSMRLCLEKYWLAQGAASLTASTPYGEAIRAVGIHHPVLSTMHASGWTKQDAKVAAAAGLVSTTPTRRCCDITPAAALLCASGRTLQQRVDSGGRAWSARPGR
jgi:hypothetical protein